jgi:protein-S-isoprenylcysteine O-methyltransferase Ste14
MIWKIKVGNCLFKYRSFTPIPLIVMIFIIFKPAYLKEKDFFISLAGFLISLFGETIRILAVGFSFTGTSGRETYLKADALNTTGIYSLVRNPLYIGNYFMFTGLVIVFANIYAILTFTVFLILQYYFIILAEEDYLRKTHGGVYEIYCTEVRRIIPKFKNYKKNQNLFNPKKVIFKENDSLFNMLIMFLLVLIYKEKLLQGKIEQPLCYILLAGILILFYIVIKIIKKRGSANKPRGL